MDRCAIVLSPWLPTRSRPFAGTFVVNFAAAIEPIYSNGLSFVRLDDTFRAKPSWAVQRAAKGVVKQRAKSMTVGFGSALDVLLPVTANSGWYERLEQARRLGAALRPLVYRTRVGNSWLDLHGSETVVLPIEEMAGRIIEPPASPRSVLAAYKEIRDSRLDPVAARRHIVERFNRPAVGSKIKALASEMRRASR